MVGIGQVEERPHLREGHPDQSAWQVDEASTQGRGRHSVPSIAAASALERARGSGIWIRTLATSAAQLACSSRPQSLTPRVTTSSFSGQSGSALEPSIVMLLLRSSGTLVCSWDSQGRLV